MNNLLFFDFKTRKNEPVYIAVNRIAFITEVKKLAVIFDIDGQEFDTNEAYVDFIFRFDKALCFNV